MASRKTFHTGSYQESKAEDVNTGLMAKLGLAEGIFASRVALITGSARGIGAALNRSVYLRILNEMKRGVS